MPDDINKFTAPCCDVCGSITVGSGECWKCLNCGNSMGRVVAQGPVLTDFTLNVPQEDPSAFTVEEEPKKNILLPGKYIRDWDRGILWRVEYGPLGTEFRVRVRWGF